jgi:hypothetical protein
MSPKSLAVLAWCVRFMVNIGRCPALVEIAAGCDDCGDDHRSAWHHLNALRDGGYIRREKYERSFTIIKLGSGLPVTQSIQFTPNPETDDIEKKDPLPW